MGEASRIVPGWALPQRSAATVSSEEHRHQHSRENLEITPRSRDSFLFTPGVKKQEKPCSVSKGCRKVFACASALPVVLPRQALTTLTWLKFPKEHQRLSHHPEQTSRDTLLLSQSFSKQFCPVLGEGEIPVRKSCPILAVLSLISAPPGHSLLPCPLLVITVPLSGDSLGWKTRVQLLWWNPKSLKKQQILNSSDLKALWSSNSSALSVTGSWEGTQKSLEYLFLLLTALFQYL